MPEGEEKMQPWGAAVELGKGKTTAPEEEEENKNKTLWDLFMNYLKEKDKTDERKLVDTVY